MTPRSTRVVSSSARPSIRVVDVSESVPRHSVSSRSQITSLTLAGFVPALAGMV